MALFCIEILLVIGSVISSLAAAELVKMKFNVMFCFFLSDDSSDFRHRCVSHTMYSVYSYREIRSCYNAYLYHMRHGAAVSISTI